MINIYGLNGKKLILSSKWLGHSNSLPPLTGMTITTTKVGTYSIDLAGAGDVVIDWGDGSSRETKTLMTYFHIQ